ncbi:uncharacterized protein JCM15063_004598 [Sporobolomyces koalae]|uniref:uncharacterized protein n=1 Tax=Sporobolomyces koalae TaxID=500713 RepID=UPI003177FEF0
MAPTLRCALAEIFATRSETATLLASTTPNILRQSLAVRHPDYQWSNQEWASAKGEVLLVWGEILEERANELPSSSQPQIIEEPEYLRTAPKQRKARSTDAVVLSSSSASEGEDNKLRPDRKRRKTLPDSAVATTDHKRRTPKNLGQKVRALDTQASAAAASLESPAQGVLIIETDEDEPVRSKGDNKSKRPLRKSKKKATLVQKPTKKPAESKAKRTAAAARPSKAQAKAKAKETIYKSSEFVHESDDSSYER